jgi:hypothetical protein
MTTETVKKEGMSTALKVFLYVAAGAIGLYVLLNLVVVALIGGLIAG